MWENQLLSLSQAKFAALWAVKHTCDSQPGFVGAPYQVISLQRVDGDWQAIEHTQDDLQEALDRIDRMERHIGDFRLYVTEDGTVPPVIPEPAVQ